MNLPDLYARVCAKRPELAVVSIGAPGVRMYYDTEGSFGWYWDDPAPKHIGDRFAAALILARWVEALPVHAGLMRGMENPKDNPRWYVDGPQHLYPCADTPIEALAEFYLGEA